MSWFLVDDEWHAHSKVIVLSLPAAGLWVKAGSWCMRYLTDGAVPKNAVRQLGGNRRLADELVSAGLWEAEHDGWRFHDWLRWQRSKAAILAARAKDSERKTSERKTVQRVVGRGFVQPDVRPDIPADKPPDRALASPPTSAVVSSQLSPRKSERMAAGFPSGIPRAPNSEIRDPESEEEFRTDLNEPTSSLGLGSGLREPGRSQTLQDARPDGGGFDSRTVCRLFSELRKVAGGGAYRLQHTDYARAQEAVAWAREESPSDPTAACRQSIERFLRDARGKEGDGWPFWAWANDPGRWSASKPPSAAPRSWGAKSGPAPVSSDQEFAELRAELEAEERARQRQGAPS